MKSLKKKFILIFMLSFAILFSSVAGILFAHLNKKVYANDDVELTIAKVRLYQDEIGNDARFYVFYYDYNLETEKTSPVSSYSDTFFVLDEETNTYKLFVKTPANENKTPKELGLWTRSELKNLEVDFNNLENQGGRHGNPFLSFGNQLAITKTNAYEKTFIQENDYEDNVFMLKNANLEAEQFEFDSITKTYYAKEFLLINFIAKENATLINISVNAKLDENTSISAREKMTPDTITKSYSQLFDLNNTYTLDTTQVGGIGDLLNEYDAQGKYDFTFKYNLLNSGDVDYTLESSFYLISENYYINQNNTSDNIYARDNVESENDAESVYVKTQDRQILINKVYYLLENDQYVEFNNNVYYEYKNGEYFETADKTFVENKTYYIKNGENYEQYELTTFDAEKVYFEKYTYNNVYNENLNKNYVGTEPRLYNTERIDRRYEDGTFNSKYDGTFKNEQDYFSFSNKTTIDYNGEPTDLSQGYLQYPTLTYDASRYNLSYTKTMYGLTTDVTSVLDTTNEDSPKLILKYTDQTSTWTEEFEVTKIASEIYNINEKTYYQYFVILKFDQVGKYVFSFDFVLNGTILNFNEAERLFVKEENWNILHGYELSIFGYQLMHSEYRSANGETEREMKNEEYALYADVTNINFDGSGNINDLSGDTEVVLDLSGHPTTFPCNMFDGKIPTTNQAPLFFRYFASLNGSGTQSYFYYYTKNNNIYTAVQNGTNNYKFTLNSNTRFTSNGLYIVHLEYTYQDYQFLNLDNSVEKGNKKFKAQIFAFEIENVEPVVEFYKEEYIKIDIDGFVVGNVYEFVNNAYVLSTDISYNEQKTYYKKEKTPLNIGGYTNKNVRINWHEALQSPFNVNPNITILTQSFDSNELVDITKNFSSSDMENGSIVVSASNIYNIKIEYGPCTKVVNQNTGAVRYLYSASVTYPFIIDKEVIGEGDNAIKFFSNFNELEAVKTNENFALIYGQIFNTEDYGIKGNGLKRSKAKISVSYSYLAINENQLEELRPLDSEELYIPNGAVISTINSGIIYNQKVVYQPLGTNSNVLTNDGIYIFKFVDEAGNETIRLIIKDSTNPILLQDLSTDGGITHNYSIVPSSNSNTDNMVNTDTKIIWGKYKTIKFDFEQSYIENLNEEEIETLVSLENLIKTNVGNESVYLKDNVYYLCIKINTNFDNPRQDNTYENLSGKNIKVYYIDEYHNYYAPNSEHIQNDTYSYLIEAYEDQEDSYKSNEHLFNIRFYDELNNNFEGIVEMTFDKSLLKAQVSGLPEKNKQFIDNNSRFETNGDGSKNRLFKYAVSNKKYISFSWTARSDEFLVTDVICKFYPLTFELTTDGNDLKNDYSNINKNYPYCPNYSNLINLMQGTTTEVEDSVINGVRTATIRTKTQNVNLMQDERYGETASVQGMYVIERTYANGHTDPYVFYIDRNNIISYDEKMPDNYIGNEIKLFVGDGQEKYVFNGEDFFQDFIEQYLLISNKQPATISNPDYKYVSSKTSNDNFKNNTRIKVNSLECKILRNGAVIPNNYMIQGNDEITIYTIQLFDGISNYPTSIEFEFAVNLYKPQAEFVENNTNAVLTNTDNNYVSKNNTKVSLVWEVDKTGVNEKNTKYNEQNKIVDEIGVNARIDENNITIKQILTNNQTRIIYKVENGTVSSQYNPANITNLIYSIEDKKIINFEKFDSIINNVNCRIEILLQYKTDSPSYYGNYLTTTKIIYFDFEKPTTNFNGLFDGDKYLAESRITKESFDDYNSAVSFDNYTFVVDSDWTLTTPKPDFSFWQKGLTGATSNLNDVQSAWYRQYDKYNDDSSENQQSIVPSDDRYDDSTQAPTRPRFNANTTGAIAYEQINVRFEDFRFPETGTYYEIIEKDCAENYRIYTIYVLPYGDNTETIYYNETIDTATEMQQNSLKIENGKTKYEINNQKIELTGFDNLGSWFNISVSGNANLNVKIAPTQIEGYETLSNALSQINSAIIDNEKTGKHYIISINASRYANLTINYRTPGQKYELDTEIRATGLVVTIDPNRYAGTYLKELKVFEVNKNGEKTQLYVDSNNLTILPNYEADFDVIQYIFTYNAQNIRNLWFEFVDNFGVKYSENFVLGITQTPFENMILFGDSYIQNNNYTPIAVAGNADFNKYAEYYSPSSVLFEYQPIIFSNIKIYLYNQENREFEDVTNTYPNPADARNNTVKRYTVFQSSLDDELEDAQYLITFTDTSNKHYQFSIHHYTKVANIKFLDSSNYEHNFVPGTTDYESNVSRMVYIKFDDYDKQASYPITTNVVAKRTYSDKNGIVLTQEYGAISSEFKFEEYGSWVVVATNQLGVSKTFKFDLIKSDAIYYSVKANANGRTIILSPSEQKYRYGEKYIDHYVSIYDTLVDANQEKGLRVEEITKDQIVATRIYKIYSTNLSLSYEKFIAVSKIITSSNIVSDRARISQIKIVDGIETTITDNLNTKYLKTNAKKVVLTLPSYYQNESNLLKVKIIYDNKDLGIVKTYDGDETITIELSLAGIYKIYIVDLAGNQQSFGGTSYFGLTLINNFIYNLNGEKGIYNSVFNNEVKLGIEQKENFVSDSNGNSYTLEATLNGQTYSPKYSNGTYLFNSFGTYYVTLKGYLNKDADNNLIDEAKTELKFTILNANEARLMHEYIGLNGYEIKKILKNNTDITDTIKEKLEVSTINKFAISGLKDGLGGSGVYQITVSALLDKIVGEKEFTYSVWINNDTDVLIIPSIKEGEKTIRPITLQVNYYQVYTQLGECQIKANGEVLATINEETASENTISVLSLSNNERYNITLETMSGNTISSFVVTKVEPLNSIAIIVIVVVSIAVVGLTITFILLRKKMRVR